MIYSSVPSATFKIDVLTFAKFLMLRYLLIQITLVCVLHDNTKVVSFYKRLLILNDKRVLKSFKHVNLKYENVIYTSLIASSLCLRSILETSISWYLLGITYFKAIKLSILNVLDNECFAIVAGFQVFYFTILLHSS